MSTKIVVNPKYKNLSGFIEEIPYKFESEGESVYKARNELKVFNYGGYALNVKSFGVPNIVNKIIYGSFRKSKARRSYLYARRLQGAGFGTPDPIGHIEISKGPFFSNSYYISLHEKNYRTIRDVYWDYDTIINEQLESEYISLIARMHDSDIYHVDNSPGNTLYKFNEEKQSYDFMFVDLNRMQFGPVDIQKGCGSFKRLIMTDRQIEKIAKEYAKERGFDPKQCYLLIRESYETFWERYKKRHG